MGTPIANLRRVYLPPLVNDEVFAVGFVITPDNESDTTTFAGQSIELLLKPTGKAEQTITQSDTSACVISTDGLSLVISKPASWASSNLGPGTCTFTLYVGSDATRRVFAFGSFNIVPRGGVS